MVKYQGKPQKHQTPAQSHGVSLTILCKHITPEGLANNTHQQMHNVMISVTTWLGMAEFEKDMYIVSMQQCQNVNLCSYPLSDA